LKNYLSSRCQGKTLWADILFQVVLRRRRDSVWRYRGATPGKDVISARIVDAKDVRAAVHGS